MTKLVLLACLLAGLLNCGPSHGVPQQGNAEANRSRSELLYPHDRQFLVSAINRTSGVRSVPLAFMLPFFGFRYPYVFVHRDGHLLFNKGLLDRIPPFKFPVTHIEDPKREEDPSLIAPWLARQEVPDDVPGAGVYFRSEKDDHLKQRIKQDFRDGMVGSENFDPQYALIVTWKNMTFANRMPGRPLKTNTYQTVIATDERRTYVMFNYDHVSWISSQDTFDGMKGVPPFVGFNAGNGTRAYEFPYSQQPMVARLPYLGFGNGLRGRYFFRVDEEVSSGSCIDRYLDINWSDRPKMTFSPRNGHVGGGTVVNVTGPCFSPSSVIRCLFDSRVVDGVYRDVNRASCVSPFTMRRGFVVLSVSVDNGPFLFHGMFYVRPQGAVDVNPHLLPSDRVDHTVSKDGRFVIPGSDPRLLVVTGEFVSRNETGKRDLVSVRMRYNTSSVVEFRARPAVARWQYNMYVLVDGEYVYFNDVESQVMSLRGVNLYQPMNMFNMSRIVAKFDSGAAVEVFTHYRHLNLGVQFYLPQDLRKSERNVDSWDAQRV